VAIPFAAVRMSIRVALGVIAAWIAVALVWGAQTALGSAVTGAKPIALGAAVAGSLRQVIPWVPVSLVVIVAAARFPLTRERWRRNLLVHLAIAPVLAFAAQTIVVLMYWGSTGKFQGMATLAREGAVWAVAKFHVALLIYAGILAVTQAVLYYRESRARELSLARVEGQLAEARLQALQAQVRPHFLFNTLHTIGQLWRSGRNDDAEEVLDRLSTLSHRVLGSTSSAEVSLGDELDLVRDYLAIEGVRFRDRLRPVVHAATDTLDCRVPSLILQPLVENAVRHGISAVGTAGLVEVTAARQNGSLILTVRDDGPGFGAASANPGAGTGLRNAKARLHELYGSAGTLAASEAPGGGALVTVTIPLARANGRDNGSGGAAHG
jgi:two-component system LytT family sensor kinase